MCLDLGGLSKAQKIIGKEVTRLALACEQALHLGNIVKSRRTKGTREETGKQAGAASLRSRPNMRACSQARLGRAYPQLVGYFLDQSLNLAHIYWLQVSPLAES